MSAVEEITKKARKQQKLSQQIDNIIQTFKKDAATKKTGILKSNYLDSIENIWKQIQVLDNEIQVIKNEAPDHEYYTRNYFEQIKMIYTAAKEYLTQYEPSNPTTSLQEDIQGQKTTTEDIPVIAEDPEQALRLRKQEMKIEMIQDVIEQIQTDIQLQKSKTRYESLMKKINRYWDAIVDLHEEIMVYEKQFLHKYFTRKDFLKLERQVEEVMEELENTISEGNNTTLPLPKLHIPYFDGDYQQWPSFHDLFSKIIHENKSLSRTEKLQYLKSQLRGEAGKLIQHLQITEANYFTAWELLNNRYDNKRLIATKLIDKILDIPNIQAESAEKLKHLHDTVIECVEALFNMNIDTSSWGTILCRIITRKWDQETNKIYEQGLKNPQQIQDFQELLEFIQRRFQSLETISNSKSETKRTSKFILKTPKPVGSCIHCKEAHTLFRCPQFNKLTTNEKYQFVTTNKLCINCLNSHSKESCKSEFRCTICKGYHNTLLHKESKPANSTKQGPYKSKLTTEAKTSSHVATETSKPIIQTTSHVGRKNNAVVLATALVETISATGSPTYLRLLIDQGSQSSFITEEAAQRLGLPREKIRAEISGLGDSKPRISNWKIETTLKPRFPSEFKLQVPMLVMSKLTKTMPEKPLDIETTTWQNHMLADPIFNKPGPIDVILGAEEFGKILLSGLSKTTEGLVAQNTEFGWIISGLASTNIAAINITSLVACIEEDKQLTKFWQIEEIPERRELTTEEKCCEELFKTNTIRNTDGTYTVRLPFKEYPPGLGNSRSRAIARLIHLEKRFENNPQLKQDYSKFLEEYLTLGHMKQVPDWDEHQGAYYIPHQPVFKEDSTTTKLRVVFDASSKTSNGKNLNETMFVGPRLQQDVMDIALRWRIYQVALMADIEKMYRQIRISDEDQKYQRILWRLQPSHPIKEYELTTVTYGTSSAPYLAVKTLQTLATDEADNYPQASKIALRDFYVDDLLTGAHSLPSALKLQEELIQMLQSGGFSLRKWSSNQEKVLEVLPEELQDQSTLEIFKDETKKSLGLHWSPRNDSFHFKNELMECSKVTKRTILSSIAKLFDPLGWLGPIIISAKMFIQELWLEKLEWDEEVSETTKNRWMEFYTQLQEVNNISLPRWIEYEENQAIELHGFCDASEKAYGAAIYSRTKRRDGTFSVHLLVAKSKVASLGKKITLPRLELCSAELLAKLMEKTTAAINISNSKSYYWTDSMITLSWINGDPHRWKTFVANRVTRIQDSTEIKSWHHVKSQHNPADLISRGVDPITLKQSSLWWNGPTWLKSQDQWPIQSQKIETTTEETKRIQCLQTIATPKEDHVSKFSSLHKMTRVIAYCRRFLQNCRKQTTTGHLTVEELDQSLQIIILSIQREVFSNEINDLERAGKIGVKSKLFNLNPFLDDKGVLRVGGRLQNSSLPYNQKHPTILPAQHHLTTLIIRNAHHAILHGGPQQTLAYIRRKFWIVNAKKTVSKILRQCIICTRWKAETAQQLMGNLPTPRVTPSPPFTHTGVDYAGPIQLRSTKGRGHKTYKGYIFIFVCLSTKAVHLEAVSDLSADSFLAAFRRFSSRRGTCAHMYSDNGTNFVAASKHLQKEINNALTSLGTQWHFIPPAAPHFGGLWEAGVKSMKYHLRRILGDSTLTFEELATLLCQIEACLNSRPLCTLSNNADELFALTPGHFLVGRELVSPPNPILTPINTNLSQRWRLLTKLKEDFWNHWSSEYLHRLQQRYKWAKDQDNLTIGTIVLQKEETINPSKWPLAKIMETHAANDGKVRVATIRRSDGTILKRPIHKLIPLPIDADTTPVQVHVQTNIVTCNITPNKKKTKNIGTNNQSKMVFFVYMILILLSSVIRTGANYTIQEVAHGLYLEHLGYAQVERGTFRIQINFEKTKLAKEIEQVLSTVNQFGQLCQNTKDCSEETRCLLLEKHLTVMKDHVIWIQKNLNTYTPSHLKRKRRGLLGNMLTAIFGVNDEVYQDIDDLEKNQKELIKLSHQQTKIMISTLSSINDTEHKINHQIVLFQKQLSDSQRDINALKDKVSAMKCNLIDIHVLAIYQTAINFIDEIHEQHSRLLMVHRNQGSFHDFLNAAQISNITTTATSKLPTNLRILESPLLKTVMEEDQHIIKIYGYFLIIENPEFTLFHITPTPLKIENETYWELHTELGLTAIDHNNQFYFHISEEEFRNSIRISPNHYVCMPSAIRNIETSTNCEINKIYQNEKAQCAIRKHKMSNTVWKQQFKENTWMFITPKVTKIAILCDGQREETTINGTGIIHIGHHCMIKTKQLSLTPKRVENHQVLMTYSKPIYPNFNTTAVNHSTQYNKNQEHVVKINDDISKLLTEERDLQSNLEDTHWNTIHPHSNGTVIITVVCLIIGAILLFVSYKIGNYYIHRRTRNKSTTVRFEDVPMRETGSTLTRRPSLQTPAIEDSTLNHLLQRLPSLRSSIIPTEELQAVGRRNNGEKS